MNKVTLGSLCYPASGQISESAETIIDYIDISSVDSNKKAVTGYQTLRFGDAPSRARKAVKENSILVSTVRPNLNAVAIIDRETPNKTIVSTGFCVLDCKENVSTRFVFHYCKSKSFIKDMISKATGASYPAVSDKIIRAALVPNYSYAEQCTISRKLDTIEKVIFDRKAELELLDDLIKARFVEMFGDPEKNPKEWPIVNISKVIRGKASNGFFAKRDEYCDDGNIEVLGVANVVNRMYSGIENLPKTMGTESDIIKFGVKYGDMLFCRSSLVAEGIGKASIVPENVGNSVVFECHVIRLPLDLKKCVPEFMQVFSTTDYFRKQIIAQSKTATMTTIGQDGILKTNILLPPLSEQRKFYAFIKQVEKSKIAVQKALDETQTLFDSLMQKYFE